MRGFWKTGKELSDRAEISRISSWAPGNLKLWISARSNNVKGGLGLGGRNFRPDFPHEGKVGGGWNLAGFLVGARATKCIPPHPSATTGTKDRLTLLQFASLKRHEFASLMSLAQINLAKHLPLFSFIFVPTHTFIRENGINFCSFFALFFSTRFPPTEATAVKVLHY